MTSGQVLNMANDECRLDQGGVDADFFKRRWTRMNADERGFFREGLDADFFQEGSDADFYLVSRLSVVGLRV